MYKPAWSVVAALFATACAAVYTPAPSWEDEPEAAAIVGRWLQERQGFDALEAWEMRGFAQEFRFAAARKWNGTQVKILSYVQAPELAKDTAYLFHLRPGERPEVWFHVPGSMVYRNQSQVTRSGLGGTPTTGPLSTASEVVIPTLHADFAYRRASDEELAGEPCSVIESRPLTRPRGGGFHRLVYWISQRTGIALRWAYYRGERELRRVDVRPVDVREVAGRLRVERLLVRNGDDELAELTLHNSVDDVELADGLFTERTLKVRRFPRF
jgi:hypothetical protein